MVAAECLLTSAHSMHACNLSSHLREEKKNSSQTCNEVHARQFIYKHRSGMNNPRFIRIPTSTTKVTNCIFIYTCHCSRQRNKWKMLHLNTKKHQRIGQEEHAPKYCCVKEVGLLCLAKQTLQGYPTNAQAHTLFARITVRVHI